jgi:hypothetical protein
MSRALPAFLLAAALLAPASSRAQGAKPGSSRAAKEHFDAAQALFDQKRYEAALVLFRQAYEETKSPNARVMIAQSLLSLGRIAEAYDEYATTVREAAAKAESEPKYAKTRDGAASELAKLENKVGKIVLIFGQGVQGGQVSVNGAAVPPEKLGAPMAVMPGNVEIVAEGLGPSPVKRTETVAAGETKTIVINRDSAGPAKTAGPVTTGDGARTAPPDVTSAPTGEPVATTGGGVRKAGFVVAGLGVAGMALFGVSTFMAEDKLAQLKKECGGTRCTDPKYAEVVDSGKMFDLLATVGLAAGIAGVAGGAAMIIFGGPKAAAPTSSATLEVGPTGAMLRFRGSF